MIDEKNPGEFLATSTARSAVLGALAGLVEIPDPLARFRARFMTGYAKDPKSPLDELKRRLGE